MSPADFLARSLELEVEPAVRLFTSICAGLGLEGSNDAAREGFLVPASALTAALDRALRLAATREAWGGEPREDGRVLVQDYVVRVAQAHSEEAHRLAAAALGEGSVSSSGSAEGVSGVESQEPGGSGGVGDPQSPSTAPVLAASVEVDLIAVFASIFVLCGATPVESRVAFAAALYAGVPHHKLRTAADEGPGIIQDAPVARDDLALLMRDACLTLRGLGVLEAVGDPLDALIPQTGLVVRPDEVPSEDVVADADVYLAGLLDEPEQATEDFPDREWTSVGEFSRWAWRAKLPGRILRAIQRCQDLARRVRAMGAAVERLGALVAGREEAVKRRGEGGEVDAAEGVGEARPESAAEQEGEDVDMYSLPRQALAASLGAAGARIRPGLPARSLLLHAPALAEASDTWIAVLLTPRRHCAALLCAVHRMSQRVVAAPEHEHCAAHTASKLSLTGLLPSSLYDVHLVLLENGIRICAEAVGSVQTAGPLHAARPPPALAWAAGAGSFPERPTLAALALRAGPSTTHLWTAPQADARGTTVPRSPPPLPNPCQALARRCARVSPAARRSSLITALATAASDRVASRAFNRGPPPRRQCHSGALSPNPCTVASPALWCSGTPSPGFHPRALALPAPAAQGSVAPAVDAVPAGGFRLLRLTPATLGPELRALLRIKHPGVPPTGWLSLEAAADVAEAATAAGPVVPVLQLALSPSTVRARCRAIEAGWSAAVAPGGGQLAGEAPHLRTPDGLVSRLVPVLAAEEAALRAIARGMTSRGTGREQRGSRPSLVHLTWREEGVSSRRRRRSAASAPRLPFLAHIGERGSLYLAVTEAVADGDWAKTLASRYLTALGFRSRCEGKGRLQVSWTRPDALAAAAEQGKETGGWAEEEWTAGPQSEWAASIAWDEEGEDGLPTSIRLTAAPSELASLPTVLWGPAVGRVDPMEARVGLSLDASATVQIAARDKLTHATVTARVQCDGCRPTVVRLRGLVPGQAYEVLVLGVCPPTTEHRTARAPARWERGALWGPSFRTPVHEPALLDVHVLESLPSPTEPLPTGVEREVPGNRAEHEVWVAPWTRPLSAGTAGADTANVARAFDAALGKAPQHESPAPLHRDPDVAAVCAQLSREALAVERAAWTRGTAACVAGSGPLLTTAPLPAGEALPQDCSEEAAAAAVAVVSGARFHAALQYTDALWRPLSGPAARPFAGLDNLRGDAVRFQTFGSTAVLVLRAHSPALDGDAATTAAAARVTSAQWRFLRKLLKGAGNEGVTTVVAVSQVTVSATARADDGVSKPTLAPSEAEAARGEDAGVLLSLLHTWVDAASDRAAVVVHPGGGPPPFGGRAFLTVHPAWGSVVPILPAAAGATPAEPGAEQELLLGTTGGSGPVAMLAVAGDLLPRQEGAFTGVTVRVRSSFGARDDVELLGAGWCVDAGRLRRAAVPLDAGMRRLAAGLAQAAKGVPRALAGPQPALLCGPVVGRVTQRSARVLVDVESAPEGLPPVTVRAVHVGSGAQAVASLAPGASGPTVVVLGGLSPGQCYDVWVDGCSPPWRGAAAEGMQGPLARFATPPRVSQGTDVLVVEGLCGVCDPLPLLSRGASGGGEEGEEGDEGGGEESPLGEAQRSRAVVHAAASHALVAVSPPGPGLHAAATVHLGGQVDARAQRRRAERACARALLDAAPSWADAPCERSEPAQAATQAAVDAIPPGVEEGVSPAESAARLMAASGALASRVGAAAELAASDMAASEAWREWAGQVCAAHLAALREAVARLYRLAWASGGARRLLASGAHYMLPSGRDMGSPLVVEGADTPDAATHDAGREEEGQGDCARAWAHGAGSPPQWAPLAGLAVAARVGSQWQSQHEAVDSAAGRQHREAGRWLRATRDAAESTVGEHEGGVWEEEAVTHAVHVLSLWLLARHLCQAPPAALAEVYQTALWEGEREEEMGADCSAARLRQRVEAQGLAAARPTWLQLLLSRSARAKKEDAVSKCALWSAVGSTALVFLPRPLDSPLALGAGLSAPCGEHSPGVAATASERGVATVVAGLRAAGCPAALLCAQSTVLADAADAALRSARHTGRWIGRALAVARSQSGGGMPPPTSLCGADVGPHSAALAAELAAWKRAGASRELVLCCGAARVGAVTEVWEEGVAAPVLRQVLVPPLCGPVTALALGRALPLGSGLRGEHSVETGGVRGGCGVALASVQTPTQGRARASCGLAVQARMGAGSPGPPPAASLVAQGAWGSGPFPHLSRALPEPEPAGEAGSTELEQATGAAGFWHWVSAAAERRSSATAGPWALDPRQTAPHGARLLARAHTKMALPFGQSLPGEPEAGGDGEDAALALVEPLWWLVRGLESSQRPAAELLLLGALQRVVGALVRATPAAVPPSAEVVKLAILRAADAVEGDGARGAMLDLGGGGTGDAASEEVRSRVRVVQGLGQGAPHWFTVPLGRIRALSSGKSTLAALVRRALGEMLLLQGMCGARVSSEECAEVTALARRVPGALLAGLPMVLPTAGEEEGEEEGEGVGSQVPTPPVGDADAVCAAGFTMGCSLAPALPVVEGGEAEEGEGEAEGEDEAAAAPSVPLPGWMTPLERDVALRAVVLDDLMVSSVATVGQLGLRLPQE